MRLVQAMADHPFWSLLTLAVLIWYSTITVYVAIRGAFDIVHLLRNLSAREGDSEPALPEKPRDVRP